MPKITMTCLKPMQYAGRRVQAGQQFDAHGENDARLLVAIGKAARYTPPVVPVYVAPKSRAILTTTPQSIFQPEPVPTVEAVATDTAVTADDAEVHDADEKPKRQYRRRDLTAEE